MRSATRSWFWALSCLGSLVSCGSSGEDSLLVTVQNLPARAVKLSLTATLDGKPAMSAQSVTLPIGQFGVVLPTGTTGHLSLSVLALDADGCSQGSGQAAVDVPGVAIPVSVSLTAQSPRACNNYSLAPCSAGTLCPYTQTPTAADLYGLWASSPTDIWAVGTAGTIVHYDGTAWKDESVTLSGYLFGVWGSGAKDVWAVGSAGYIAHFDGQSWTLSRVAVYDLTSVYGISASDVWAAGGTTLAGPPGEFWHWNGQAWGKINTGINNSSLLGVWASSTSDITAVGYNGLIIHWDGTSWSSLSTISNELRTVWGQSSNLIFAGGYGGAVLRNNGTGWTQTTVNGYAATVYGIVGAPDGSAVYAVGNKGVNGDWLKGTPPYDSFGVQSSPLGGALTSVVVLSNGIGWVAGKMGFLGYFDTRP